MIEPARQPTPLLRRLGAVAGVNLLHLGCQFHRHVLGAEKIAEHVVARPVPARPPFDGAAVVAHAPGAAHHQFEIGHLERDMIERRAAGEAEHHAVVIAIAREKAQPRRGVGERKAERVAVAGERGLTVAGIDVDVG